MDKQAGTDIPNLGQSIWETVCVAGHIDLTSSVEGQQSAYAHDREVERDLRRSLIQVLLEAGLSGMTDGTHIMVSARLPGGSLLITPPEASGADLIVTDIIRIGPDGLHDESERLTRELVLHRHLYASRHDIRAILHLDSPAASALASLRRDIPAFHESVALAGGHSIRCSEYAMFASAGFAKAAVAALTGRRACLLANHGQLTISGTPAQALSLARTVEALSDRYLRAAGAGTPALLSPVEMDAVLDMLGTAINSATT